MEGNKCAVCSEGVDSASSKKTRKRLYGASCTVELNCLKTIVTSRTAPEGNTLMEFKLDNHEAWLCIKCQQLFLKIKKLKDDLTQLKADIKQKLDLLCMLNRPASTNIRKQSLREESTSENNDYAQIVYAEPTTLENSSDLPHTSRNVATSPEVSVSIV